MKSPSVSSRYLSTSSSNESDSVNNLPNYYLNQTSGVLGFWGFGVRVLLISVRGRLIGIRVMLIDIVSFYEFIYYL